MSNYAKDDIDRWFEFSYLPSKRTIYVGSRDSETQSGEGESGTDCKMSEFFLKAMLHLTNVSSKPIFVHMNNIGGDYQHGMAIYDAIRLSPAHVYGIAWSYATSMGSIILQAFDTRIITPNCIFMLHDGTEELSGTCKTVEAWAKNTTKTRQLMYKIYYSRMKASKPRITIKKIEELCSHDTIFNAEEAVASGLADWIMEGINDQYRFFATDTQDAKWTSGMTSDKREIEGEHEAEENGD